MEHQLGKNMEHEMETQTIWGILGRNFPYDSWTRVPITGYIRDIMLNYPRTPMSTVNGPMVSLIVPEPHKYVE